MQDNSFQIKKHDLLLLFQLQL